MNRLGGPVDSPVAHDDEAVEQTSGAFREALAVVRSAVEARSLERFLHVPAEPGFYAADDRSASPGRTDTAGGVVRETIRTCREHLRPVARYLRRDPTRERNLPLPFDAAY